MIHSTDLLKVLHLFSDIDRWFIENWALRGAAEKPKSPVRCPPEAAKRY